MRELDVLLVRFVEDVYPSLQPEDKHRFSQLLELPDPDLHACLVGRQEPPDPDFARLLTRIRSSLPT